MLLRERLVKLLYIITDLASHPPSVLEIGTPSFGIIPHAVLDLIYGGTFSRQGIFSFSKSLLTFVCRFYWSNQFQTRFFR